MSFSLKNGELRIERIRRSGPGGQHRNKKATGIRITHLPTGIIVLASNERSQQMNLRAALKDIEQRLAKKKVKKKKRIATKVTRGSKERRLKEKKIQSQKKEARQKIDI